jgi:hypothetical protein
MAKLFVASPMYGGMCTGHYTQAILQLQGLCQQNRIDMAASFMFNESLITRARNSLVHGFLKSGFTHLMFIDADIRFNPNDIMAMLLADKEIICGIYPKKEINWDMVKRASDAGIPADQLKYYSGTHVVNLADRSGYAEFEVSTPGEILNGGTGFMLIKREVFEKLSPLVPTYVNNATDLSGKLGAEEIKEFFTTSIEPETQHLLSEDYHFCRIWREAGGKIYAAPWAQLGHVGTYLFDGSLAPAFPEKT